MPAGHFGRKLRILLPMGYRNLRACVNDLSRTGQLRQVDAEVDPYLEVAAIQRRVYAHGGPALLFTQVRSSRFPVLTNLFGTVDRARFLFRDTLSRVRRLIELKVDPASALRRPWQLARASTSALNMLPRSVRSGPIQHASIQLSELPKLTCWPNDGGPFITLPEVYTEQPGNPGWRHSNLGMYRVQLAGNDYVPEREVGLHYQIHRGIGVHHAEAVARGERLPVQVWVGGAPAMILAAVMPLPEGLSELGFAGALAGHRIPLVRQANGLPLYAEADFFLTGTIDPQRVLPEGPFGDHLGYYSLKHDFPVMTVDRVWHRPDAIWPFTTVGRPPQEDTTFGALIHELTGPVVPTLIAGVKAVHAVDAAGVHPLLIALGSERYTPYSPERRPQELLTQANAILGQGQMSLAKYLIIAAANDDPQLNVDDLPRFFHHVLSRIDWRRDLHFQTRTTIDTLDYSGSALHEGSKVVMAAAGPPCRELPTTLSGDLRLPAGFEQPRLALPGIVVIQAPRFIDGCDLRTFCEHFSAVDALCRYPLVVLADDSEFTARTLNNFLWVTFTRSNPAADIDGVEATTEQKHWGCRGSLVIDARIKPQHAPPLVEDPAVERRIDELAARGGPLHGIV